MFVNIFFLFILLLIIGGTPSSVSIAPYDQNLSLAITSSIAAYAVLLIIVAIQNLYALRKRNQETLLTLTNIELLLYFLFSYFILGVQRLLPFSNFQDTTLTLYTLLLYFFALYIHHFTAHYRTWGKADASKKALKAVFFMLPFAIPFLILIFLAEIASMIPLERIESYLPFAVTPWMNTAFFFAIGIAALVATMIFLPPVLVYFWHCLPLENNNLTLRFQTLCTKAHFKHGGFKKWNAMDGSYNAAIIGIIGKLRYVMFTPKLLNKLTPNALTAILAHEIGHNRYRHLLIYPLILFGMVVTGSIAAEWVNEMFVNTINTSQLQNAQRYWATLYPIALFIPFVAAAAIYFRYVFGYFSRLFERQADLYLYEVDVPPEDMITALDEIAHAAGGIHHIPNWHHGSIQDRINFLQETARDPSLIKGHHRKVRISLAIYLVLLFLNFIL